jgi:RNA polymerase sigma factor (sigma-70 family)
MFYGGLLSSAAFILLATGFLRRSEVLSIEIMSAPVTIEDRAQSQLDKLLSAELSDFLRISLSQLPPAIRKCFELRLNRGLSYKEIACTLGVSLDTVKAYLYQGKLLLREKVLPVSSWVE